MKQWVDEKVTELIADAFSIDGMTSKQQAIRVAIFTAEKLKDATNDAVYQNVINELREKLEASQTFSQ